MMKEAYLAGGCFWCISGLIEQLGGVISVESGFSGGTENDPSYDDVKAQLTGHRETVKVTYDGDIVGYPEILRFFLENVDPFDGGGQFIDRGRSYTLAIYFGDAFEKEEALKAVEELEKRSGRKVFVSVEPFTGFFRAEDYHQNFREKHPEEYEKELEESGRKEKRRGNMKAVDRFLDYVRINTKSDENSGRTPSTDIQFDLADRLVKDLKAAGVENAERDGLCYVYGSVPATKGLEDAPAIGFISHMDTSPDFSGEGVKPRIVENYDGSDIELGCGRTLSVKEFPHLKGLLGQTLIVTDGSTLLGGDDKAGCAEIVTAIDELILSGKPHGKICVAFTPDEEIGCGADHFSVERFGAKYAYTVDGGCVDTVDYETFNAAKAVVTVKGFNVHPGSAKDIMINAQLVAMEFNSMLPPGETPRDTEGYEGFFHLCRTEGDVEKATLQYIIRDHDPEKFELRKAVFRVIESKLNEKYGAGTVSAQVTDQYRNMAEVIKKNFHLIENALAVIAENGSTPKTEPVRGGTDGSRLSFMGLPCPNLGTGTYAMHGPYEHTVVGEMETAVKIILGIIGKYASC